MSNSINFVGRLGGDGELKDVGSHQVLEFSVANNTGFGEKQVTNWFRCAIWGARASKLDPHLTKGKQVFICGELSLRKYNTNDGVEKVSADVKVDSIDFVGGGDNSSNNASGAQSKPSSKPAESMAETEEDLPF